MKQRIVNYAFNLQYYKLKLWEKIVLYFVAPQQHEQDGMLITYKLFRDRLYVFNHRRVTYLLPEPPNGGVNKPWTN